MTDFPGAGAAAAARPGALLAAARRASGMSVADVAVQMRISPRQVQAIEADQYEQLPGAVFVRGFVRNYARLLKIDPVPLLHALEPALEQEAPLRAQGYAGTLPVPARRTHARLWLAVLVVVVAVIVSAGIYEYLRARRGAVETGADAPQAGRTQPTEAVSTPASSVPVDRGEPVPLAPERVPDTGAATQEITSSPAQDVTGSAPGSVAATPLARSGSAARLDQVKVEFVQESWFELRDRSGTIVYAGTGAANTARSFEADGPLSVVIGNAPGVRITYNDKPVELSAHAARNIARFTLE